MRIILYLIIIISLAGCHSDSFNWELDEEPMDQWIDAEIEDLPGSRYGVRWQVNNPYDLGERCYNAKGLRARFGIGKTEGHSDFDFIFPWSQIRRCNIKMMGSNAVITFDDQPNFSIDGSNGDVFVRIPKFYIEKYIKDGYEYRIISKEGTTPHPAFIEDGQELDAVYVSAFEGHMGSDSLLRSIANVIPTSNITAQQFLDAAQRRGSQFSLYDMRTVDMLFSLIAVEFGCRNTGVIFGNGISNYHQPIEKDWDIQRYYYSRWYRSNTNSITCRRQPDETITEGSAICICEGNQRNILTFARVTDIHNTELETTYTFDGPPINITTNCFIGNCGQTTNWIETCSAPHFSYSGRANMLERGFLPRERNPMRYRWMENIVGNLWHFLPDVTLYNHHLYVCSNMKHYKFGCHDNHYEMYGDSLITNTDNGTLEEAANRNFWTTTLLPDDSLRGISFGNAFSRSITSKDAFGSYYYVGNGLCIFVNGGGFDHRNRCNLLTSRAWDAPNIRWHLYGARLIFKNVKAQ
ncbi:MAG: hypothetical protein IKG77_06815 [Prevotella sp.]|nr:hypothetical protein [Prevotella sp.]